MKRIFTIVACIIYFLVAFDSAAQSGTPDSSIHLYLLVGQSNMAGRGKPDAESRLTNAKILMLDSTNNWVPATDPVHFDKPKMAGVGPAISFANEMLRDEKNISIGLIPCAWGGSPVDVWKPGAAYLSAHPYDDAIRRTKIAMQKGVLKGILWHQGEADNDSIRSKKHLNELVLLVQRFRKDFSNEQLPFVAGEVGYFNKRNFINAIINQLPNQLRYTSVVAADGLTDKGDHLHFDTPSARELGKRYARAMKRLQKK